MPFKVCRGGFTATHVDVLKICCAEYFFIRWWNWGFIVILSWRCCTQRRFIGLCFWCPCSVFLLSGIISSLKPMQPLMLLCKCIRWNVLFFMFQCFSSRWYRILNIPKVINVGVMIISHCSAEIHEQPVAVYVILKRLGFIFAILKKHTVDI